MHYLVSILDNQRKNDNAFKLNTLFEKGPFYHLDNANRCKLLKID